MIPTNITGRLLLFANRFGKYIAIPMLGLLFLSRFALAASSGISLVNELSSIQAILMQVGPALSAVLFVLAGIMYAMGQMLPPERKANFHSTAINIIIGAIVVGALSVASTSLATASTHLLSNFTVTNSTA